MSPLQTNCFTRFNGFVKILHYWGVDFDGIWVLRVNERLFCDSIVNTCIVMDVGDTLLKGGGGVKTTGNYE